MARDRKFHVAGARPGRTACGLLLCDVQVVDDGHAWEDPRMCAACDRAVQTEDRRASNQAYIDSFKR